MKFISKEKLYRLIHRPKIKFWTIQRKEFLHELSQDKIFGLEPSDPYWKKHYDWMVNEMGNRLPNHSGRYPIWGWVVRPNLREIAATWNDPKDKVVICCEVDSERVLASDFDLWHHVLNCWEITPDFGEHDYTIDEIKATWGTIFDPEKCYSLPNELYGKKRIWQICVEGIDPKSEILYHRPLKRC